MGQPKRPRRACVHGPVFGERLFDSPLYVSTSLALSFWLLLVEHLASGHAGLAPMDLAGAAASGKRLLASESEGRLLPGGRDEAPVSELPPEEVVLSR